MDVKNIIRLLFLFFIIGAIAYVYINKIPMMCFGCETDGTFTKCLPGTGNGTPTCDALRGIEKVVDEINKGISKADEIVETIETAFTVPYQTIKDAINTLENTLGNLNIPIPNIPEIKIPPIPNLSCPIDFTKIPTYDPCNQIINKAVNDAISPVNTTISGIQTTLNTTIGGINTTIGGINKAIGDVVGGINEAVKGSNDAIGKINSAINAGIPTIPGINNATIPTISATLSLNPVGNINLSCNIDIGSQLKSLNIDICKEISNGLNTGIIAPINTALATIQTSLNIAIQTIISGIHTAINTIKNGITSAINALKTLLCAFP
jgi:hypothetical protein